MRWIVGDIQGCVYELDQLLKVVHFDPHNDELWCLGDLINRGPESLATLRLWKEVGGKAVIGNHEVYALMVAAGQWPRKQDTLDALFAAPDSEELLRLLQQLPVLVHLTATSGVHDVWLVHAGLNPCWKDLDQIANALNSGPYSTARLEHPDLKFATRVRCCTRDGQRSDFDRAPADCPPPFQPWDRFYQGSALVVHGHWAFRGYYRGPRTLGLDSGCVYGGPLTAWCQEEDRIVQISAIRK